MSADLSLETLADDVAAALSGPCAAPEGTPLVAACSGGGDSVALVAALGRLQSRWPLAAVAFVDHGLRDVSADRLAARRAAELAGAPFKEARVVLETGENLQGEARRARYAALLRIAGSEALIATGHSLTDQAETVLQRLVRGAGLRGLASIRARDGRVVRPLLGVSRERLHGLDLARADDPSNGTDAYQRNRLRHHVLPLLREENPRAEEALAAVATHAQAELELLDALMEALAEAEPDLRGLPEDLACTWVRWRLDRAASTGQRTSRAAARELARQLVAGHPGATVSLGGILQGVASDGRLSLREVEDPRNLLVAPAPGTYRLRSVALDIALVPCSPGETPLPTPHDETWLDPTGTVWPLKLRRTDGSWVLSDGSGATLWRPGRPGAQPRISGPEALRVRMIENL